MDESNAAPKEWIDRDEAGFDRAVSFIDATFALALTLLVTTIDVENRPEAFQSLDILWARSAASCSHSASRSP
jgi:hypothetical protein